MNNMFRKHHVRPILLFVCLLAGYSNLLIAGGDPEWLGTYRGILPCADCEGIQTELTLNANKTYDLIIRYQGKKADAHAYTDKFSVSKDGAVIMLSGFKDTEQPSQYMITTGALIQLTLDGKRVEGDMADKYILVKGAPSIEEKYWKLIVLHGSDVSKDPAARKEPNLMLKAEGNRVTGSGGCNTFTGTYSLSGDKGIRLGELAITKMACEYEIEPGLLRVLAIVDNYEIKGDTLLLMQGDNPPSAKFVAVYRK